MGNLTELKHVSRTLKNGTEILALDTGAAIPPEANAMLQALYSRSLGSVRDHLAIIEKKGPAHFMKAYYVQYGHKSIGDCGTGTLFIEGCSMLAAKAIQDWMLYSGQEASTRYLDFAEQPFLNPAPLTLPCDILRELRAFYTEGLPAMQADVARRFPRNAGEDETQYEKAVNARAFDIMRSFLPAGAATKVAWHSNLRQMADHLETLRHHPLEEVRDIALAMEDVLIEMYPNSFTKERHPKTEAYNAMWMRDVYYNDTVLPTPFKLARDTIDYERIAEYGSLLHARPPKALLPPSYPTVRHRSR